MLMHFFISGNRPPSLLLPTPNLTALPVVLFLWLNGWMCHLWCAILLYDIMDVNMLGLWYLSTKRTLICVLCNKVSSVMRSDTWVFLLALWFNITHTQHTHMHPHTHTHIAHSGDSRLTHPCEYMFTPHVM